MIVQMVKCDNPECEAVAHPEEGSTPRKIFPPFGWISMTGFRQGPGPNYKIMVCSAECATPALQEADYVAFEKDRE